MKRLLCLLAFCLLLPACSDMQFQLPQRTADGNDVYCDEFKDVPIPRVMKVNRKDSMVTVSSNSVKTGIIVAEGRVEKQSLSQAMINNMAKYGWTLRSMARSAHTMELFEKGSRFAVIDIYSQLTGGAVMEVWVGQRINQQNSNVHNIVSGQLKPSDPAVQNMSSRPISN